MEPAIDPAKARLAGELKYPSPILAVRFDPSGRYALAGANDNAVVRFSLADGKAVPLAGHESWVRAIGFAPPPKEGESPLLITADYAGRVCVRPLEGEKPEPTHSFLAHDGWIRALAVSPDGKMLATCGNDRLVKLWTLPDCKPAGVLKGHESHVYNVAFHPKGGRLASGDLKGIIKDWDIAKGEVTRELDAKVLWKFDPVFMAEHGGVRGMAFSADGTLLACSGITDVSNAFAGVGKPLCVLFDWETGKPKQMLRPKEGFQGTAWNVVFHPSGFLVVVGGGSGGQLWFFKPDSPQNFHTLPLPTNGRDLTLHPDGTRLAVASPDNQVRLVSLVPPPPMPTPPTPPAPPTKP